LCAKFAAWLLKSPVLTSSTNPWSVLRFRSQSRCATWWRGSPTDGSASPTFSGRSGGARKTW